jgi:hypothetical protein
MPVPLTHPGFTSPGGRGRRAHAKHGFVMASRVRGLDMRSVLIPLTLTLSPPERGDRSQLWRLA